MLQLPPDSQKWSAALTLSHVCRHWRDVALDNAVIWSTLDFSRPKLATLMLERARNMPISILISEEPPEDSLKVITRHWSRIKDLHLSGPYSAWKNLQSKLRAYDSLPRALVESFQVEMNNEHEFRHMSPRWPLSDISHLRHVMLVRCSMPRNSSCLNNLISLTIDCSSDPQTPHSRMSVSDILQMLSRNPQLETLVLRGIIKSRAIGHPLPQPVMLQNLDSFNFDDTIAHQAPILSAIRAPQMTYLSLANQAGGRRDWLRGNLSVVCGALRTFLENAASPVLEQLGIIVWHDVGDESGWRLPFSISGSIRQQSHLQSTDTTRTDFRLSYALRDMATVGSFLTAHFSLFPLQDVTVFRLEKRNLRALQPLGHERELWEFLARLPRLEQLLLDHVEVLGISAELLGCLMVPSLSQLLGGPTPPTPNFRSLLYIRCYSAVFNAYDDAAWTNVLETAVVVTKSRQAASTAVLRLTLCQKWFMSEAHERSGNPAKIVNVNICGGELSMEWYVASPRSRFGALKPMNHSQEAYPFHRVTLRVFSVSLLGKQFRYKSLLSRNLFPS